MANDEHVALLKQGVEAWNAWRDENPDIRPGLARADLITANLSGANLARANLSEANLYGASLFRANLSGANLKKADLSEASLSGANLKKADLSEAILNGANLSGASLSEANLREAYLIQTNLRDVDLRGAYLVGARLSGASLWGTDLTGSDLSRCHIDGVSAWGLKLEGAKQQNLVITREDEPTVTVDNIEVAQFIYLLLNNQKVRDVIDTITSKAVLILGRFTVERKAVLDALREELRQRNYLPILFDFEVPATRDITEMVSLLARMARFIVADLTGPSSISKELEAIVPGLAVPVQPLLEGSSRPYAMFTDYMKYDWVLPVCRYEGLEPLLAALAEKVIAPAEAKVKALKERRRIIEAELATANHAHGDAIHAPGILPAIRRQPEAPPVRVFQRPEWVSTSTAAKRATAKCLCISVASATKGRLLSTAPLPLAPKARKSSCRPQAVACGPSRWLPGRPCGSLRPTLRGTPY
jgi:Pentapeptide repeats (8 copies)